MTRSVRRHLRLSLRGLAAALLPCCVFASLAACGSDVPVGGDGEGTEAASDALTSKTFGATTIGAYSTKISANHKFASGSPDGWLECMKTGTYPAWTVPADGDYRPVFMATRPATGTNPTYTYTFCVSEH